VELPNGGHRHIKWSNKSLVGQRLSLLFTKILLMQEKPWNKTMFNPPPSQKAYRPVIDLLKLPQFHHHHIKSANFLPYDRSQAYKHHSEQMIRNTCVFTTSL